MNYTYHDVRVNVYGNEFVIPDVAVLEGHTVDDVKAAIVEALEVTFI